MKLNYALLFLLALIFSTALPAQRGTSIEERMKRMDKELDLSDKQYSQIETTLNKQSKTFGKLRSEAGGDREQMRRKARKIRRETDDKILEILDKEQKKKYRKHMEERRKDRQGGKPGIESRGRMPPGNMQGSTGPPDIELN